VSGTRLECRDGPLYHSINSSAKLPLVYSNLKSIQDFTQAMNDEATTLHELKAQVRQFGEERDWQQFHDLKNLSMAIAIEAAELMEHFRWIENTKANAVMNETTSAAEIREEVADVLLLLTQFANVANIDLMDSAEKKLAVNAARYPVEKFKGISTKYNKR